MMDKTLNQINNIINNSLRSIKAGSGENLALDILEETERSLLMRKLGVVSRLVDELETESELLSELLIKNPMIDCQSYIKRNNILDMQRLSLFEKTNLTFEQLKKKGYK